MDYLKGYWYVKKSYVPHYSSKNKIEVELDLSNCATKSDLKNATSVDTSQVLARSFSQLKII